MSQYKIKVEWFNLITYVIIIMITLYEVMSLDFTNKNYIVIISFVCIGSYSFMCIVKAEYNMSVYRMFYIFTYIFFFMAPLQQYSCGTIFWTGNGLLISFCDRDYLYANFCIILFCIIYDIIYSKCVRKQRKLGLDDSIFTKNSTIIREGELHISTQIILLLVGALCFGILLITNSFTSASMIVSNSAINAQLQYILRFIPLACLMVLILRQWSSKSNLRPMISIFVILCCVIFFPLWGNVARFFLLGSYLVIYALFFSNQKRKKSILFLLMVLGFSFSFSKLRLITSVSQLSGLAINFNHVDFDAYQMLMSVIKYTDANSIAFGKNIISAVLFLLPRSIWTGKLEATGAIVMEAYGSWFENVSMPLVGEAYFAFGIVGIIVIPILFAKISAHIDGWNTSNIAIKRLLFCLFSGMTIYIMRGALLPAMSFLLGISLSIIFVCWLCKLK